MYFIMEPISTLSTTIAGANFGVDVGGAADTYTQNTNNICHKFSAKEDRLNQTEHVQDISRKGETV